MLETVTTGRVQAPRRIMLYGTQGIGKSTFASMAPAPIFIQTEDGLGEIDCAKFPLIQDFSETISALQSLANETHEFQTVVIDSLDWLERMIWDVVCLKAEKRVNNIEEIGYGKGYIMALNYWRAILAGLTDLRAGKGMTVILIAHAKIERFENPETESYDRYTPRLHKHAAALVQEWCDEVLFATYKVYTKQTDEGFKKERVRGVGTGERIIRTTERPSHVAKNRLNLPEEIPLDFAVYASLVNQQQEKGE